MAIRMNFMHIRKFAISNSIKIEFIASSLRNTYEQTLVLYTILR